MVARATYRTLSCLFRPVVFTILVSLLLALQNSNPRFEITHRKKLPAG
jgi:hypothetical protein